MICLYKVCLEHFHYEMNRADMINNEYCSSPKVPVIPVRF